MRGWARWEAEPWPCWLLGSFKAETQPLDARMMQELGLQNPAPGAIARFAGPTDKGWRMIAAPSATNAAQGSPRVLTARRSGFPGSSSAGPRQPSVFGHQAQLHGSLPEQ